MKRIVFMEMNFGNAHDIWCRVVCGDNTLTNEEVKAAEQWFDDFITKLSDKASHSKQELEAAMQTQEKDAIEKWNKAVESDERQLDVFIRRYDDLIRWLNTH